MAEQELSAPDWTRDFTVCSFGGFPTAQVWSDFYLWEALLNEHKGLKAIVEFGTFQGGFSLYLAAQAAARGLSFRTYDSIIPDREIPGFVRSDIFAETEMIGHWLSTLGPLILFCDNGNKPRELRTFPPYLCEGSVVVVHDWMDEAMPEDVPGSLTMIHGDFCDAIGSVSRVFAV